MVSPEDQQSLPEILELGVNDFLMLPLDRTQLDTRLRLIESRHREIDQMRALQHDVKAEYDRFLIATGGLGDGIWDLDLTTETIHYSERWKQMLGYEPTRDRGHARSLAEPGPRRRPQSPPRRDRR